MKGKVAALVGAGVMALAAPVVMQFEGKSNETYLDPVGVPTICFGHTATADPGDQFTDDQCEQLLDDDMRQALEGIASCVDRELDPNEWAALVSWTFNVGTGNACGSTLVELVNAGEAPAVWCRELPRWVYAGGERLTGLERRRRAEMNLCLE